MYNKNVIYMYEQIETYYNASKAYLLFLRSELTGKDEYKNFILDRKYQVGSVLANLSSLLLATKEDIVENEGELIYSSKVFDFSLLKSVDLIATVEKDGVKLDNYLFSDKETLVATIRNKIAHGDFKIDFENNLVILNVKNNLVRIDIDKLSNFVVSAFNTTIKDYKGSSYKRNLLSFKVKDKKRTKPLTLPSEFRNVIKFFVNTTFEIKSNDGSEIDKNCRDLFEYFLEIYKEEPKRALSSTLYKEMIKYLKANNCTLSISDDRLKEKELIDYLEEYARTYILTKNFSYEEQITLMGMEIAKYFDSKSYRFSNALAYSNNLILLKMIKKANSVDHKVISTKLLRNGYNNMVVSYNELGASIINMFESLYMYPFESLYMPTKEYSEEKKDLDFALLDTSLFTIDIININDAPLKEMKARCDACLKRVAVLTETLEKCQANLENVRKSGNKKATQVIESQLKSLTEKLEEIKKSAAETKKEYDAMLQDYSSNSNFFKNEAIITGIRNSIAHGNYEIVSNPEPIILFRDVYEGETTFKAMITLANFYLFIDENSKAVLDFVKQKEKMI